MKTLLLATVLMAFSAAAPALAHDYRSAKVACEVSATSTTYEHPTPRRLHDKYRFELSVEADETGALIASMTRLPEIAGAPLAVSEAPLETVTWHYNGYIFPWDDNVPSINIALTNEQVRTVLLALNKNRPLDLPSGDLGVNLDRLALAKNNPFSGAQYGVEWTFDLNFEHGVHNDGLSYSTKYWCIIKSISGTAIGRSGD